MPKARISVLIPSYNHANYIEETIRSIWNLKQQDIEIILIDDGSKDATAEIAERLQEISPIPMRVIRQDNQGLNKTLNRALALATGAYVAYIASDDMFAPDRFSQQLAIMEENPDIQVTYANGRLWYKNTHGGRMHSEQTKKLLGQSATCMLEHLYSVVPHLFIQTCLFRHDFLVEIGGFDDELLLDDWPLNIRIFKYLTQTGGKHAYIDTDVIFYRQHATNGFKDEVHLKRILQVVDKYVPETYKPKLLSEIYWSRAKMAIRRVDYKTALRYFLIGQKIKPSINKTLNFAYKTLAFPLIAGEVIVKKRLKKKISFGKDE